MAHSRRIWIPFAGSLLLLALIGIDRLSNRDLSSSGAASAGVVDADPYFVQGTTDRIIARLQDRLQKVPDDERSYVDLASAYLQKVRENGDPSYYPKAEAALKKALELKPNDADAMGVMGSLCLGRHQFRDALVWGQKAIQANPYQSYYWGVVGDAHVELGQYPEAVDAIQKMVDMRPDLSSYARVSYVRELHGDVDGAIEAMGEAVDAGRPGTENTAWTQVQLGNLHFNRGDLANAERQYQQALMSYPDYVYAQAGMARIYAARGDTQQAIALLEPVVGRIPLPEFVITLGDLYQATGQKALAERQYALVRVQQTLAQANGVDTDMEMALFDADHNTDMVDALARAQAAMRDRPNIHAADALAWTLYGMGRYEEAWSASQQALRLGTKDALIWYHAGMITYRLGKLDEARANLQRALSINPYFSILHAAEAQSTLRSVDQVAPAASTGGKLP